MNTKNLSLKQRNTKKGGKADEKKGYNNPPVQRVEKPKPTPTPPPKKEKEK